MLLRFFSIHRQKGCSNFTPVNTACFLPTDQNNIFASSHEFPKNWALIQRT